MKMPRYQKWRAYAIEKLGGKCVICGATTDLQIDHIYRADKNFAVSQWWSSSRAKMDAELAKCQLLCRDCHKAKTLWEVGQKAAITTHGTLSAYRYCKCRICRKAYSDYYKEYQNRKKPKY